MQNNALASLLMPRTICCWITIILLLCALGHPATSRSQQSTPAGRIAAVHWTMAEDGYRLRLSHRGTPTYTLYELNDPPRIVVDFSNTDFGDALPLPILPKEGPVREIRGRSYLDRDPTLARVEIFLVDEMPEYRANQEGNDLLLRFPGTTKPVPTTMTNPTAEATKAAAGPTPQAKTTATPTPSLETGGVTMPAVAPPASSPAKQPVVATQSPPPDLPIWPATLDDDRMAASPEPVAQQPAPPPATAVNPERRAIVLSSGTAPLPVAPGPWPTDQQRSQPRRVIMTPGYVFEPGAQGR